MNGLVFLIYLGLDGSAIDSIMATPVSAITAPVAITGAAENVALFPGLGPVVSGIPVTDWGEMTSIGMRRIHIIKGILLITLKSTLKRPPTVYIGVIRE